MRGGSTRHEGRLGVVVCVDFGSTFTKAALVDLDQGRLVATAEHRTTVDTDVLDGWHACRSDLGAADPRAVDAPVRACSSAGGGLRIAVVGNEELVTAEAGRRVALSSGGRVVHVSAGGLDVPGLERLWEARPDVVLLVGGTDGGNQEVLLGCAAALADTRWPGPVVVAGNVDAQPAVAGLLEAAGTPSVRADNVVPRIGVLAPASARAAIRRMFLEHVIGGKHLSRGSEFAAMVQGATPDVVLTAVELLSRGVAEEGLLGAGDVVVVDVGGATTDVYSAVEPPEEEPATDPDLAGLSRGVVGTGTVERTVEGDLGMRWSAVSAVAEAQAAALVTDEEHTVLRAAARRRADDPAYVPTTAEETELDLRIAECAVAVALRRHAGRAQVRFAADAERPGGVRLVERSGTDLREVALLVGSGGALRHADTAAARLLDRTRGDGGWQVPEAPRVVIDRDYVLAPAGLLTADHPVVAHRLLESLR